MSWPAKILALVMFAAAFPAMQAADPEENKPAREESGKRREEGKKLSPGVDEAKAKEWKKTNSSPSHSEMERRREGLKNMTPEERAAKRKEIKERLEKRIADLRSKQTNATVTAQEIRELERREQILKRFEQDGVPRIERPNPVLTNSPAEN